MTVSAAQVGLRRAQAKTTALSSILFISSSLMLVWVLPGSSPSPTPFIVQWWVLAAMFAIAEIAVFHVQLNQEAHTFSLSEVPTIIGLLFAGPAALIVGRIVGEALTLSLRDRQSLPKLVFNLSMFLAECTVGIVVYSAMQGDRPVTSAQTWLAATFAVLASDTLSALCVIVAIRWHGAVPEPKKLFGIGAITAIVNIAIGIAASMLFVVNPNAGLLLAILVVVVYGTYRSYSNLLQRHSDLRMLYEFTTVISRTANAEQVLDRLLDQAQNLLRGSYAEIEIDGPADQTQKVWRGELPRGDLTTVDGLRNKVVGSRRALVVSRSEKDEQLRGFADRRGCKDLMMAPLSVDSRVFGTLLVANRLGEVSSFDADDARLLQTFANHAGVALENGRLIDRLGAEVRDREHQATHDDLTGLPNRALFYHRLRSAIECALTDLSSSARFTVVLMDLDRFKDVNDTLGHHAGDLLLQEVARRIRAALPPEMTLARLGGDEFAVLASTCRTEEEGRAVAQRILDYLRQPCYIEGLAVDVGASVGLAMYPEHGHDAFSVLKRADIAMYEAKSAPDHVAVYDELGDAFTTRRLRLASELREAVEAGALEVVYQPKLQITSGDVIGVEALLRWHHPEHGNVWPEEFIPIAEQTGMIIPLTTFVLETALREASALRLAGYDLSVAVNVPVRMLPQGEILAVVQRLLGASGTPPNRLTLEVTETGMMTDPRATIRTLESLADLGVRISIDDFGTGYSSLSYLQRLPVHEMKIDCSFVMTMNADPGSATIVRSIIDLGRNLQLDVVAEGVEDAHSLSELRRLGCSYAQGYFISRPLHSPQLGAWLHEHHPLERQTSPNGGDRVRQS